MKGGEGGREGRRVSYVSCWRERERESGGAGIRALNPQGYSREREGEGWRGREGSFKEEMVIGIEGREGGLISLSIDEAAIFIQSRSYARQKSKGCCCCMIPHPAFLWPRSEGGEFAQPSFRLEVSPVHKEGVQVVEATSVPDGPKHPSFSDYPGIFMPRRSRG